MRRPEEALLGVGDLLLKYVRSLWGASVGTSVSERPLGSLQGRRSLGAGRMPSRSMSRNPLSGARPFTNYSYGGLQALLHDLSLSCKAFGDCCANSRRR